MGSIANLLLTINLLGFSAAPFTMPSTDWSSNPAMLSFFKTTEFGLHFESNEDTIIGFGLASPVDGIFAKRMGDEWQYGYGLGFRPTQKFAVGFAQVFGTGKQMNLGVLYRPFTDLSIGLSSHYLSDSAKWLFDIGLGVRPFGNSRLVILADASKLNGESDITYSYGVAVQPIDGLTLFAKGTLRKNGGGESPTNGNEFEHEYRIGISLAFSKVKVGAVENGGFLNISSGYYKSFVPQKHIVVLKLRGGFSEAPEDIKWAFGKRKPTFYEFIKQVRSLKDRRDVVGVLILSKRLNMSVAQLEEFRSELVELRKSGKKILFHANNFGLAELWLASTADEVAISPMGGVIFPGFLGGNFYFKRLFDKIGIEVDAVRIGRYKSAVEPFTRESMSEYERQQLTELLNDYKSVVLSDIAEGFGMTLDSLENLINTQGVWNDSEAVAVGFADTAVYAKDAKKWAKKTLDCESTVDFGSYVRRYEAESLWPAVGRPKVALLVAEGGIVVGKSRRDWLTGKTVGDESMTEIIEKLRKDKSVKAVVLRVNSPGGSALASEAIWQALRELSEEKPVVVSMGSVAASGGYYISAPGDIIVADRTTITGSIGVLSIRLIFAKMFQKLGVNFDYVKWGRHADALSAFTRPMTEEEETLAYREIRYFYNRFVDRVATSRGMTHELVDSLGEGRIYSGLTASDIGLVDSLGGLLDAIEIAKKLAGLEGDVEVVVYPKPKISELMKLLLGQDVGSLEATKSLLREDVLYLALPPMIRLNP